MNILIGNKKKKIKILCICLLVILILLVIIEFIYSNSAITVTQIEYTNSDIPANFHNSVIVQISDYHNQGGSYQKKLVDNVKSLNPDYIFLTGDIVDSVCENVETANDFLEKISKIAPCYLVWGNHDYEVGDNIMDEMVNCCKNNNIQILDNKLVVLNCEQDEIIIAGICGSIYHQDVDKLFNDLDNKEKFEILLHHYPEDFQYIVDSAPQVDLVFSGHAHGGLIRLPFIKGLFAPGQGLFPEYTKGKYRYKQSDMIVSAGVGNSGYTRRFGDPFEVVAVTLKCE